MQSGTRRDNYAHHFIMHECYRFVYSRSKLAYLCVRTDTRVYRDRDNECLICFDRFAIFKLSDHNK